MPGSILAYYADSFTTCVAFITLATACHQAWSANLFTIGHRLVPAESVGFGRGPRRDRRRHRRHVHDLAGGAVGAVHRQSADGLHPGGRHASHQLCCCSGSGSGAGSIRSTSTAVSTCAAPIVHCSFPAPRCWCSAVLLLAYVCQPVGLHRRRGQSFGRGASRDGGRRHRHHRVRAALRRRASQQSAAGLNPQRCGLEIGRVRAGEDREFAGLDHALHVLVPEREASRSSVNSTVVARRARASRAGSP